MAGTLWDVLSKAANLAQLSGLHAVMLVAVGASLLRLPQSRRECARLELCSRRLRTLLEGPMAMGCGAAMCTLFSEMAGPAMKALADATDLVDSYNDSTLWRRARRGRSMATQLRDMQDVLDSYYGPLLLVHAHLLLLQTSHNHPRPSQATTTTTRVHEANETSQTQSVQEVSNCPKLTATCDPPRANEETVLVMEE